MSKKNRGHVDMSSMNTSNEQVCMSVRLGVIGFSFPCSMVTAYFETWANVFHVDKC